MLAWPATLAAAGGLVTALDGQRMVVLGKVMERLAALEQRIAATTQRLGDQRALLAWRQQHGFATAESRTLLGHLEDALKLLLQRHTMLTAPDWDGGRR